MPILPDGSVVPSYLSLEDRTTAQNDGWTNFPLRMGEVYDIIYPKDPRSISGQVIEYLVLVQHFDHENMTGSSRVYSHCVLLNSLGSFADKFVFTLRPSKQNNQDIANPKEISKGSKVLLLCINGDHTNAVIIGGIRDQGDKQDLEAQSKGHFLHFVFNGIQVNINNDGEMELSYLGKTDIKGKTEVSDDITGTKVALLKNGNFKVSTNGGNQSFTINHESHTIEVQADSAWNINVNGDANIKAGSSVSIQGGSTVNIQAGAAIALSAGAGCSIMSTGLSVGSATDKMIKGSTYRNAESGMNNTIASSLSAAVASFNSAAISLEFSDTTGAGIAIAQAASSLQTAAQAINSFENSTYLSDKNSLD